MMSKFHWTIWPFDPVTIAPPKQVVVPQAERAPPSIRPGVERRDIGALVPVRVIPKRESVLDSEDDEFSRGSWMIAGALVEQLLGLTRGMCGSHGTMIGRASASACKCDITNECRDGELRQCN